MRVGSLFSGVGGFDLGCERAGHEIVWQVEYDEDCQAVLRHRFPHTAIHADINAYAYGRAKNRRKHGLILPPVDIVVGGFPCQDVSIAGQRKGLAGSRSGLFFAFMRILAVLHPRPQIVIIENVPGLLTSHGGRDFHTVLAALAERGFRRGYRILDSQYFGLAQRRKRVFVVGCARTSGLDPAEILFESTGRAGHLAPRRPPGPCVAASLRGRSRRAGVNVPGRGGEDDDNLICFDWQSGGDVRHNASSSSSSSLQASQTPAIAYTLRENDRNTSQGPTNIVIGALSATGVGTCGADDNQAQAHHIVAMPILEVGARTNGDGDRDGDGIGAVGDPMFTLQASKQHGVFATLNAGGHDGGFRTEPGEHQVLSAAGERARALTGTMFKRHDEDTDTLIPVAKTLTANYGKQVDSSDTNQGPPNLILASAVTASAGHHGHSSPRGDGQDNLVAGTLAAGGGGTMRPAGNANEPDFCVPQQTGVRRLTPYECEILQGFPPGWTCLCGEGHRGSIYCTCPDTPRYKQMGNAVSVPVAQWIAERIPVSRAKVGLA